MARDWEKIGERGQWVLRGLAVVVLLIMGASMGGGAAILVVLGLLGFVYFCWWVSGKVRYPSILFLIIAVIVALLMAAMAATSN